MAVSEAGLRLSRKFSPQTDHPAYAPFTPNKSGQRLPPPCYRGCWHGVSGAFSGGTVSNGAYSTPIFSSLLTEVYAPRSFIPHAALLRQPFGHCAIFLTAASRRSLGRISVPVWPVTLSGRLPIEVLVSRYLTNKLMGRRFILWCKPKPTLTINPCEFIASSGISTALAMLSPS